jgi:5-methylcytosine-specific restriction enzyme subunit McrC
VLEPAGPAPGVRCVGRIPLRNIWFLLAYASESARFLGSYEAQLEDHLDDLPNLVGRLLAQEVERRMRHNLSRGYQHRNATLTRVRGRIDLLTTSAGRLLDRGEVACRFDELTLDTPRNRLVRAALERLARLVTIQVTAQCCRRLAGDLAKAGVSGLRPSRADLARGQMGRNDMADQRMLSLSRLAFDLALPSEEAGSNHLMRPEREEHWVRLLFEKAVTGLYDVELKPKGWRVRAGERLRWPTTSPSDGIGAILPGMKTDIILDAPDGRRLVIDTKFTSIVTKGWHREESLKPGYLYQIYAYLRSQEQPEDSACRSNRASGVLLHPAIGRHVDESVTIQGHQIRFVTVDLSAKPDLIRRELLAAMGVSA